MGRLNPAEATSDVMRPYGVWAVITPFNFPTALSGGPAGAALVAGNTVVVKPPPQGAWTTLADHALPAGRRPARRMRCTSSSAGDEVGQALVADPRVDGITFTGSYEVGMEAPPGGGRRLPAADHLRDGWQEPGHREPPGRPRPRRGGHGPIGLRAVGPEVLGRVTGLRRAAGGRRVRRAPGRAGQRHEARVIRATATPTWARSSTRPPSIGTSERSPRPTANGEVLAGGRRVTDGRARRGYYLAPTVVEVPRDELGLSTELFVPLIAVERRGLARRGVRAGQRHAARADRRVLLAATRPRSTSSSTASRPGSSTSTGRRAPPPAPGRGCSPSVDGRARGAAARRAAARTTCSSTCASRAERSWRSRHDGSPRADPGGRRAAVPRARHRAARARWRGGHRAGPGRHQPVDAAGVPAGAPAAPRAA